jgi:hypothetical protein
MRGSLKPQAQLGDGHSQITDDLRERINAFDWQTEFSEIFTHPNLNLSARGGIVSTSLSRISKRRVSSLVRVIPSAAEESIKIVIMTPASGRGNLPFKLA